MDTQPRPNCKVGPPTGMNLPEDKNLDKSALSTVYKQLSTMTPRERAVVMRHIMSTLPDYDPDLPQTKELTRLLTGIVPIRLSKNPKWERDPEQQYGSFTFIPDAAAKPGPHGVYGIIRCHKFNPTEEKANAAREHILTHVDSMHRITPNTVDMWYPCVSQDDVQAWSDISVKVGGETSEESRKAQKIRNETMAQARKVFQEERDRLEQAEHERNEELAEQADEFADIGDDSMTPEERAKWRREREASRETPEETYVKLRINRASVRYNRELKLGEVKKFDQAVDNFTKEIKAMQKVDHSLKERFPELLDNLCKKFDISVEEFKHLL